MIDAIKVKCFVEPAHLGFILAHLQDNRDPIHFSKLKPRHLITDETYYQTIIDALDKLPHDLQVCVHPKRGHILCYVDVPISLSSSKPSNINNITASASSIDTATTGVVCVDLATLHLLPRAALWATIHDGSISDENRWGRSRSWLIPAKVKWCFLDSPKDSMEGVLDPPWEGNPWEPKGSHGRVPLGPLIGSPSIIQVKC